MATIRAHNRLDALFDVGRMFFQHKMDQMRKVGIRREVYRNSYHDLSILTDRDLKDLGIPRSNIKKFALEAAYGH